MHLAEAPERDQGEQAGDAAARPPLGRLHRHRTHHHRHPRPLDTRVRTHAVHHVGAGTVRRRDAQAVEGPRGGLAPGGLPQKRRLPRQEHAQDQVGAIFVRLLHPNCNNIKNCRRRRERNPIKSKTGRVLVVILIGEGVLIRSVGTLCSVGTAMFTPGSSGNYRTESKYD
jgi:hypothetical protein